jgi:hypothetical protein
MYAAPYLLLIRLHRLALDARRKDRTWRYYVYSLLAGLLASILVMGALLAAYAMVRVGWWWLAIILLGFFAAPPLQTVLARHVLGPLGLVRTSYWLAHAVSMDDSDAYGLTCAAYAHAHKPTPEGEAWITGKRDKRVPLGDSEIIVTAFLAAARGDADTTRQLLRSTESMVENHPLVRELAGEWLAADAAERGAWGELYADAAKATWPASSLTFFLEGVAARNIEAAGAPSLAELRVRWLLAPHRRTTRVLLQTRPVTPPNTSTTATVSGDSSGDTMTPAVDGAPVVVASALPAALAAHLELSREAPTSPTLAAAVTAWDTALIAGDTQTWLGRRALELDAPLGAVDRAIREIATTVTDELARLADVAGLSAPNAHGPVGDALARRLRHGRLDALEAGFTRWEMRRHDGSVRAPIDEWREYVALRASYDAAVAAGGLELRRLAFPHAYKMGTSMAVWLWNSRNEYALSHAISAWLLDEALAVGDTEAIDLCTRNTRLTVPTRTGDVTKER